MKKNLLSKISIFLSFINVLIVLNINYDIAIRYLSSTGKSRALFLAELTFNYKFYFLLISLISLILCVFSLRKKEHSVMVTFAFVIGVLSIIVISVRIWRFMI